MSDLFPATFVSAIERLRLDVRPAPAGAAAGLHRSPSAGQSLDFRDYRPYAAGDDLRRVDWNVYRRTGHLFLRRFEHPSVVSVEVRVDISRSMFVETPSRYAAAARITAAICAAALTGGDTLRLRVGSELIVPPSGRRGLPHLLDALERQSAGEPLAHAPGSTGVLVVVSDFFGPEGVAAVLAPLEHHRGRLLLVQITQPWDADPTHGDDAELIDCENGQATTVAATPRLLAAYRDEYQRFQTAIETFAAARGASHVRVDASADAQIGLAALFPRGVLRLLEAAA